MSLRSAAAFLRRVEMIFQSTIVNTKKPKTPAQMETTRMVRLGCGGSGGDDLIQNVFSELILAT